MTTDAATKSAVHPLERSGLGVAPFRCVRIERRVGPIDMGNGCSVGAPGQPMGTCDYCGNGIAECCVIQDASGAEFIVGNVCVYKTTAKGVTLYTETERLIRAHKRTARHAREAAKIADAVTKLETVRPLLAAQDHPQAWAKAQGLTLADWCDWMLDHAGNAGKLAVARLVNTAIETTNS